jgi:hypothetical protein
VPERRISARYPTDLPAWQALKSLYRDELKNADMRARFARDKARFDHFSVRSGDLLLD